jgi:DNA-binding MarR family transcriptional regulator
LAKLFAQCPARRGLLNRNIFKIDTSYTPPFLVSEIIQRPKMNATRKCSHATPTPEALASRIGELLRILFYLENNTNEGLLTVMNESGLTVAQVIAINFIGFSDTVSLREITEKVSLSASATSHMVDRLVTMGYVTRTENNLDRRQKKIALSAKGSELHEQLREGQIARLSGLARALSPELRCRFASIVEELIQELARLQKQRCTAQVGEP